MTPPSADGSPPPEWLGVPIYTLNRIDGKEQNYKDVVHQRFNDHCEIDHQTGCWIYTGSWDRRGIGKIRVGVKVYSVARVSAWLYLPGFELWDERWVFHTVACGNLACFNFAHLAVAAGRAEAQAAMRAAGLYGSVSGRPRSSRPGRKLTWPVAREIRRRVLAGEDRSEVARMFNVLRGAVNQIADDVTWREENAP